MKQSGDARYRENIEGEKRRRRRRKGRRQKRGRKGTWKITSILRPSTRVPWSFSRAFSASALDSNVTKPKPCGRRRKLDWWVC